MMIISKLSYRPVFISLYAEYFLERLKSDRISEIEPEHSLFLIFACEIQNLELMIIATIIQFGQRLPTVERIGFLDHLR